ncbi:hypothetical protein B0T25DRAFT_517349 [Lasiosphaeria hispida]|uniref:Uncharacterized protein n=1 Tax=Lasiosphaeria hispida TaxID=260671 RepID=A0AAJ0MGZ8_9PEZI|nr:hypothetical protein B0T25DRAFT_517349 [Lasiosphaeria hispida]
MDPSIPQYSVAQSYFYLQPPLPDVIGPPSGTLESSSNETYRRQGLTPEMPSLEIFNFYVAVLLKEAKSLPAAFPASSITSHAAFFNYVHTHIISPLPITSMSTRARTHLPLLTSSPTLSQTEATF